MKKIIIFVVFCVTVSLFAGMDGTEQCKRNIENYASKISQLQNELGTLNAQIEDLKNKILFAESKLKEFTGVFLIPRWLEEKKCKDFQEQKSNCEKQLSEKTPVQQNLSSQLAQAEVNKKNEEARLHRYQKITLEKIEINSYGGWDTFDGPEICVFMGGKRIMRGPQDTRSASKTVYLELPENISSLAVADEDLTEYEDMGNIPLKLDELDKGVSGDTDSRTIKGTIEQKTGLGFSYEVTYNIEY